MKSSAWLVGVWVVGLAVAGSAQAQRYRGDDGYGYRDDERYDDRRGDVREQDRDDVGYDYARVVRVDPVIVRDPVRESDRCYDRPAQGSYGGNGYYGRNGYYGGGDVPAVNSPGRSLATVIGGVAGAVVGSRFGGGSGQILGTAVGTVAGGLAGQSVYDANHPQDRQGYVRVCDPVPDERERVDGYDVTYEYGGRTYRTHSDYNPGDRIRVRVEAVPE